MRGTLPLRLLVSGLAPLVAVLAANCRASLAPATTTATIGPEADFGAALELLLRRAHAEQSYNTLLLQYEAAVDCVDEHVVRRLAGTAVIIVSHADERRLHGRYNNEMFAILCLRERHGNATRQLEQLALKLTYNRVVRVLVITRETYAAARQRRRPALEALLQAALKLSMLNVIVLHADYASTGRHHSYAPFPNFVLEEHPMLPATPLLYPNRVRDMRGKEVLTLPDLSEPRTLLYTDAKGVQRLEGYIGQFMSLFTERHNCTLRFRYNISETDFFYVSDMQDAVRNGSLEIAISLGSPTYEGIATGYTYTLEIGMLYAMWPIEGVAPTHSLIFALLRQRDALVIACMIMQSTLLWLLFSAASSSSSWRRFVLYADVVMRGMLGLAFYMPPRPSALTKKLYMLLFILGLYFATLHAAQLMQFLTTPPRQPLVANFDEALRTKCRIMAYAKEFKGLLEHTGAEFARRYRRIFVQQNNLQEFVQLRKSFDTRYAYLVTRVLWVVLDAQQRFYGRPLFRISNNLRFGDFFPLGLPLPFDSPLKRPLDDLILRVHANGLFSYWVGNSFFYMLRLGRISVHDLSGTRHTEEPLIFADFYWLWIFYITTNSLALLIFIVELWLARRRNST